MRGIEMPERTEDFTADPVELFFDLGYVLAFSQLVGYLVHHPDWAGAGRVALLFWLMWLPWSQFTWSANVVSGNGRTVRLLFLVGTVTSVPMAASVSTAFEDGGPVFAVCLAVIYGLAFATMLLAVEEGSAVRRSITSFGAVSGLSLAIVIAGSFVDGDARVALWIVAIVIGNLGMVAAGGSEWIVRFGHFAERHALIVIIALGEVIVAIGVPVIATLEDTEGLPASTVVVLAAAGAFAAMLWWAYFDRPGPAIEHRAETVTGAIERGRFARDVYTAAHAPVVGGIILAAAAIEEIALHPDDHVHTAFRVMLAGGLGLFAFGIAAGVWRAFHVVARERLVAAVVLAVGGSLSGIVLLLVVDAIILATLVVEHLRIEGPQLTATDGDGPDAVGPAGDPAPAP